MSHSAQTLHICRADADVVEKSSIWEVETYTEENSSALCSAELLDWGFGLSIIYELPHLLKCLDSLFQILTSGSCCEEFQPLIHASLFPLCNKTIFALYDIFFLIGVNQSLPDKAVITHYWKSLHPFTSLLFLVFYKGVTQRLSSGIFCFLFDYFINFLRREIKHLTDF